MAENKEGQEKTEFPTPKRLVESKDKGQVAKSTDVTTAGLILLGGMTVFIFGNPLFEHYRKFMRNVLYNSSSIPITDESIINLVHLLAGFLVKVLLPIILIIFIIAYAGEIAQVGFTIASKKFTNEGMRWKQVFNPFSGLKRIFFSKRSLFELAKSIAKIVVLGGIVVLVLYGKDDEMVGLLTRPYLDIAEYMVDLSFELVWKVGLVYILIAVADFVYQRWQHREDLKMTKQEIKDEMKQSEGDPQIKGRMKQMMQGRIRSSMMKNAEEADVVITNPTHYAIALKYKVGEMEAPVVVAKGADHLAFKIRDIAENNDVPIVEEPPLARTLYFNVEVDDEIPENLFKAVAQILAYIYNLKQEKKKSYFE